MNISVTKASTEWGVSRTTIYQKINDGELSRTSDKKIDTAEMLRVFGEPVSKKRTEQLVNNTESTHSNSLTVQDCTALEHQLALEKLTTEHLRQQVNDQKHLIENYQQQLSQLTKTLEKANASIHDFAQVRLLEFKKYEAEYEPLSEPNQQSVQSSVVKEKKRWWNF
ncbi:plasmid replication DNA-binding protein [Psychrobacter sp. GP33]|uniref:plasmid replication DNA-binding protein n=1 Tax=Psychrobacter sp. GP33 TaxID=2758709 RepID=UPI0015F9FE4C|nr:plasmid replication DNA-binding protein [Psychrobacter sp. GP33]